MIHESGFNDFWLSDAFLCAQKSLCQSGTWVLSTFHKATKAVSIPSTCPPGAKKSPVEKLSELTKFPLRCTTTIAPKILRYSSKHWGLRYTALCTISHSLQYLDNAKCIHSEISRSTISPIWTISPLITWFYSVVFHPPLADPSHNDYIDNLKKAHRPLNGWKAQYTGALGGMICHVWDDIAW